MWAVTVRLTPWFPGWWWWGWVSCSCRPHNCCCTWSCTGWWWTPCPPTTRGKVSGGQKISRNRNPNPNEVLSAVTVTHRQRAVCELPSTSFKTMRWIRLLRFNYRRDESWLLCVFRHVFLFMMVHSMKCLTETLALLLWFVFVFVVFGDKYFKHLCHR